MAQIYKRRAVREKALQILYACELNGEPLSSLLKTILSDITNKADKEFACNLVNRVLINKKELDERIMKRLDNWEMNRITLIDKILLRMGICELLYFSDIPPKVSINEAIEVAKIYSTKGSGKFINGILDAILFDLKKNGELNKAGRGLLEESISKTPTKK